MDDAKNAFRRYTKLQSLGPSGSMNVLDLLSGLENVCGDAVAGRIIVYGAWARLLRDQADDAVLSKRPACRRWFASAVHYDIALNADSVSSLLSGFGPRDADVRHISALLSGWAKRQHMTLPPLSDNGKIEKYLSSNERAYDVASATSPADC